MTITDTGFGGRPISGDISHYTEGMKEQDDPQVFLDALDKLLAVPGVESVRWQQYTPYFNDGEACVFRIYDAYVRIAGDTDQDAGDYGDGYRSNWELSDGYGATRRFKEIGGFSTEPIAEALGEFTNVLESGRHYVVLEKKFGDPAQVTATAAGFEVEYYEHD